MKSIVYIGLFVLVAAIVAAQCNLEDCGEPCLYEIDPASGMPMGQMLDCPPSDPVCFCVDYTLPENGGQLYTPQDPSSPYFGRYFEGWCHRECEPDVPEFGLFGAGIILAGAAG